MAFPLEVALPLEVPLLSLELTADLLSHLLATREECLHRTRRRFGYKLNNVLNGASQGLETRLEGALYMPLCGGCMPKCTDDCLSPLDILSLGFKFTQHGTIKKVNSTI